MAGELTVILYTEDFEDLGELEDADAGILLKAIMQYLNDGSIYDRLYGDARVMFRFIRRHIDRDKAKYAETCKKRAESGKLGGRPKKANGYFGNQMLSEKPLATFAFSEKQKNPDYENDYEHENEYVYVHENENEAKAAGAAMVPADDEQREKSMYEDPQKRIKFLKTMIGLYSTGALRDEEVLQEYRTELAQLEGGG